jgi:hypothetical protein
VRVVGQQAIRKFGHGGAVGDIEMVMANMHASPANFSGRARESDVIDVRKREMTSAAGKRQGDPPADPAGGARYDGRAALKRQQCRALWVRAGLTKDFSAAPGSMSSCRQASQDETSVEVCAKSVFDLERMSPWRHATAGFSPPSCTGRRLGRAKITYFNAVDACRVVEGLRTMKGPILRA